MTIGERLDRLIVKMAIKTIQKTVNIDMPQCKFCQSTSVVKNGKRNSVQYYLCRDCGRGFVYNKGLPRMRYPIDIVADGVYNYYAGESLDKIRGGICQRTGLRPSNSAICKYYHGYAMSLLHVEAKLRKISLPVLLGQLSLEIGG